MKICILQIAFLICSTTISCNSDSNQLVESNNNLPKPDSNLISLNKYADSCKTVVLGDILLLDFKVGMTESQFNKHKDDLIKSNKLNPDASLTLSIPQSSEYGYNVTDYHFTLNPEFEECHLKSLSIEYDAYIKKMVSFLEEKYGIGTKIKSEWDDLLPREENEFLPAYNLYWTTRRNRVSLRLWINTKAEPIDHKTIVTYESTEVLNNIEMQRQIQEKKDRQKANKSKEIL